MSVRYGGKQIAPRDTKLTEFCVGSSKAVLWRNPAESDKWSTVHIEGWTEVDCRLVAGDTLRHTAGPDDPPPHYNVSAPKHNTTKSVYDSKTKTYKVVAVEGNIPTPTPNPNPNSNPNPNLNPTGYVGKPIGKSQAVWLRGLWLPGMTDKGLLGIDDHEENDDTAEDPYDFPVVVPGRTTDNWRARMDSAQATMSLYKVLQCCDDFANEPSILQDVIQKRGHICRFCVKYITHHIFIVNILYSCDNAIQSVSPHISGVTLNWLAVGLSTVGACQRRNFVSTMRSKVLQVVLKKIYMQESSRLCEVFNWYMYGGSRAKQGAIDKLIWILMRRWRRVSNLSRSSLSFTDAIETFWTKRVDFCVNSCLIVIWEKRMIIKYFLQ